MSCEVLKVPTTAKKGVTNRLLLSCTAEYSYAGQDRQTGDRGIAGNLRSQYSSVPKTVRRAERRETVDAHSDT